MIQSIYTSVNNANLVQCGKKGLHITSDPIPLLRDKYLSEYRTELERAKVRKNLGIKDDLAIIWGLLEGTIEELKDLIEYFESKWEYTSELDENIKTIKDALDYTIAYVTSFKSEADNINNIYKIIQGDGGLNDLIDVLKRQLLTHSLNISGLDASIKTINKELKDLNLRLLEINVDKNILQWVQNKLEQSKTLELREQSLEVTLSDEDDNAITLKSKVLEPTEESTEPIAEITPGLYVKDLQPNIDQLETITLQLADLITNATNLGYYKTELSDETTSPHTIGGIDKGTSVADLKGKTIILILDYMLFPAYVRELVYPQVYYSSGDRLVEVNSAVIQSELTFIANDAGTEISRLETLNYKGVPQETSNYTQLGIYTHTGSVKYNAGDYLVNNRGEVTNKRIEAGTISTTFNITTTYPWFINSDSVTTKQPLVEFGVNTEAVITLKGDNVAIKLPGKNSQLQSFEVNAGLGFLAVNLEGWVESTTTIGGYSYKTWTKKDKYLTALPHKLKFKLIE